MSLGVMQGQNENYYFRSNRPARPNTKIGSHHPNKANYPKMNNTTLSYTVHPNSNSFMHSQAVIQPSDMLFCSTSSSSYEGKDVPSAPFVNSEILSVGKFNDSGSGMSALEQAIMKSSEPLPISNGEEIEINGCKGIWANKNEEANWRGSVPLKNYPINQDATPNVLTKKSQQELVYKQELAVRYLRPPTPPRPGDIIIQEEACRAPTVAPPLIIRQQPPRPCTPEPLVIREAPPPMPPIIGKKIITISGKRLPPPPRKVVIERLPPLPNKPQAIVIERWLPYCQPKRRVIFKKNSGPDPSIMKPKNVIIQWEPPTVRIQKEFKNLGTITANPADYVARFGNVLKRPSELPKFILQIKHPEGLPLAADCPVPPVELEGDLHALKLIDLDKEGLGEYKGLINNMSFTHSTSNINSSKNSRNSVVDSIFSSMDPYKCGRISILQAERVLNRVTMLFGKTFGTKEAVNFFENIEINDDGTVEISEFKRAIQQYL